MSAIQALRSETPKLIPLFLPIVVSQYASIASGVVDSAMAGSLGTLELASIAVGVAVWVPFQVFILGIIYGLVIFVSQAFGADDRGSIDNLTQQSLYLALLVGPLAGLVLFFVSGHLGLLGVQEDVASLAGRYIRAEAWGLPLACLMFTLRFYCEGQKVVVPVTVMSVIIIGVKAFFNYGFMFGNLGMPELGVVGCGIATVCTNFCFLLMLAGYVCLSPRFAGKRVFATLYRPDPASFLRIAKTGAPIGLCFTSEFLVFSVMTMFISREGAAAAAAHQVAFNCMILFFSTAVAFAGAACIRVGNLYGSGDKVPLRTSVSGILVMSVIIGCVLMAGMVLNDEKLVSAFIDEATVIPLAVAILHVAAFFQIVDAMQVSLNGVLRGIGDVGLPFVFTTVSYWAVGIPAGYLFSGSPLPFGFFPVADFGVVGWWMGITLALFITTLLLGLRVRAMFWNSKGPVEALQPAT
ncbi:MAG: MATE family efflux transporter [Desulfovibrio sp.]|uniref:MATE family efflux transporter n=1 Tax=Desulfovibrio sp. 7SRBS1 TaxID=3378064 RepID=UPI003B4002CC